MSYTPEQFVAASKGTLEAGLSIATALFAGAERIAALNLNSARSAIEESVATAKSVVGVSDIREVAGLPLAAAQPSLEKAVAYSRSVYEITVLTQESVAGIVEAQLAKAHEGFLAILDLAGKNGPAGSDVAIAAVKTSLSAASTAYESLNKAAKQVAEIAQANVTAATDATVKAAGAAVTKLRKVA